MLKVPPMMLTALAKYLLGSAIRSQPQLALFLKTACRYADTVDNMHYITLHCTTIIDQQRQCLQHFEAFFRSNAFEAGCLQSCINTATRI